MLTFSIHTYLNNKILNKYARAEIEHLPVELLPSTLFKVDRYVYMRMSAVWLGHMCVPLVNYKLAKLSLAE